MIRFDAERFEEYDVDDASSIGTVEPEGRITWVDVQGLGNEETLWALAERFGIHLLALEDIVHVPQRPKTEIHEEQQLIVAHMARLHGSTDLDLEQVSILLGDGYLLTFQERYGDVLDPVRKRLRQATGQIRHRGADYLSYAIIDTIVDGYFPVVEKQGDGLESLEHAVLGNPSTAVLHRINALRSQLLLMRRSIWAHREVLATLARDPHPHIEEATRVYFRDTYDHTIQLAEVVESQRETAGGLVNTYLTVVSQRTNEVMKVLTIMATLFIPLTFITGVYGMNFEHMPELHARWAYPALWGLMAAVVAGLLYYFRRKGWLGSSDDDRGSS